MVSAPRNMVSTMPRACSSRSVKIWPRSGSAQSWISSTATNSTRRSSGIASTVQEKQRASGGTIFSSPVISATFLSALAQHHAVVILARQQAQRKADDAGGMAEQALDRQMGLAGVGGAEHRLHPRRESGHGVIVGANVRPMQAGFLNRVAADALTERPIGGI